MAKFGQNGDKHGPRKQVDVAGPLGPIGQRRLAPLWCRSARPGATLALYRITDSWEPLQNQWDVLI